MLTQRLALLRQVKKELVEMAKLLDGDLLQYSVQLFLDALPNIRGRQTSAKSGLGEPHHELSRHAPTIGIHQQERRQVTFGIHCVGRANVTVIVLTQSHMSLCPEESFCIYSEQYMIHR
jgi:hypothetical protein